MRRWALPGLVGICVGVAWAATPEEEALSRAAPHFRAIVSRCANPEEVGPISGRLELDAQAHDGELVSLIVHSEAPIPTISQCFCQRAPVVLAAWAKTVEQDSAVTLPFLLGDGSGGTTGRRQSTTCRLGAPREAASSAPAALPAGRIAVEKVKVKGSLTAEQVSAALETEREALERCYRQDLVQQPGYAGEGRLNFLVQPDGSVEGAGIEGLAHQSIAACQVQHLLTRHLPPAAGMTEVQAKILYTPE